MHLVTNLGDLAVLLPASLGLIAFLVWVGAKKDAAAYSAALAFCLLATLLAKLAFAVCGARHELLGVESPNGHAAFGATFYGCLALLFAVGRLPDRRLPLYFGAAALILLIGASRVALGAHTAAEVAVGLVVGAISIALFGALRARSESPRFSAQAIVRLSPFAALYGACLLSLAGHWSAEPVIDAVAGKLGAELRLCRSAEVDLLHGSARATPNAAPRAGGAS